MRRWAIYALALIFPLYVAVQMRDSTFEEMNARTYSLDGNFAQVKNANELLGTGVSHGRGGFTCTPAIARVSHLASLSTDVERPQVLLSGEIHGDERIGPTVVYQVAYLLVNSARCALDGEQKACNTLVDADGLSSSQIIWLAFLATRRDTFIIPSANCLGYKYNVRSDAGVDPNRDFAYSRDYRGGGNDDRCLRSTTARIFNKLLELTLFQLVITFHGGMQAIAYEWGSKNHDRPHDKSPDDKANSQLGETMSYVAGFGFPGASKPYRHDTMNSIVYSVDGGMEDWMYAAGWDRGDMPAPASPSRRQRRRLRRRRLGNVLRNCTSSTNTHTPPDTRALVFLVETSDRKGPATVEWGDGYNVLGGRSGSDEHVSQSRSVTADGNEHGNGHVPRNIRLALSAIDSVQPYVCINKVLSTQEGPLALEWSVGGAFSVDATWLSWHPAEVSEEELGSSTAFGLGAWQVLHTDINEVAHTLEAEGAEGRVKVINQALQEVGLGPASAVQDGSALWFSRDKKETPHAAAIHPFVSEFKSEVAVPPSLTAGEYWVAAWAVVDGDWGQVGQGEPANLGPQSWMSKARTNTTLRHIHREAPLDPQKAHWADTQPRALRGRAMWASAPLRVRVDEKGVVSVLAVTIRCAWWNRGPLNPNRSALPPMGVQPDPPSDIKFGDTPQPPSSVRAGERRQGGRSNAHTRVQRHQHDMGKTFSLLLGFFALACFSVCASKVLPALLRRIQAARHRRSHQDNRGAHSIVELPDPSTDRYERAPMLGES